MSEKRRLNFANEDEMLVDLARLRKGYRKLGNWTLPMTSRHLAIVIERSLMPPASPTPTPEQAARKAAFVDVLLKTRRPPAGFTPPPDIMPTPECDDAEIARLEEACRRLKAYPHALVLMGPFGPVPIDEFREITLMHSAHHLALLIPTSA